MQGLKLGMGILASVVVLAVAQSAQAQLIVANYAPVPMVAGTSYYGGYPSGVVYGGAYTSYYAGSYGYAAPVAYAAPVIAYPTSAYVAPVGYAAPVAVVGGPAAVVVRPSYYGYGGYGVATYRYRPWGGVTVRIR